MKSMNRPTSHAFLCLYPIQFVQCLYEGHVIMVEKEGLPVCTESYWVTNALPFFLPFLHWLSLRVNVGHHRSCRVDVMCSTTSILSPFLVHQLTHPCRVSLSELMSHEEAICESFLPGDCTEHPCDAPPGQRFWMSALVLTRVVCKVTDPPYRRDGLAVRSSCNSGTWMMHSLQFFETSPSRLTFWAAGAVFHRDETSLANNLLCPSSLLSTHRVSPGHCLLTLTPALQTPRVSSFSEPP